ncbi:hypothetical protein FRB91_003989 [Serendipita sp. 411]|nr:hypothetical protein FRB91_003989 [Serendipita sp. 411]
MTGTNTYPLQNSHITIQSIAQPTSHPSLLYMVSTLFSQSLPTSALRPIHQKVETLLKKWKSSMSNVDNTWPKHKIKCNKIMTNIAPNLQFTKLEIWFGSSGDATMTVIGLASNLTISRWDPSK